MKSSAIPASSLHDPAYSSRPHANLATIPLSQSEIAVQSSGQVLYLNGHRGEDFKAWFAPAFATYLQAQFTNPEQVATAFGVRNSTAWNWWNGENRASGDAVARLFMTFPDAAAWFMQEWNFT